MKQSRYDVAIIGAGPAGCVSALAQARRGKSVLLLEANPKSSERLAGEWLHPPALTILGELGVNLAPDVGYQSGRGFAVFPDDGTDGVVLPYQSGEFGVSIEHHRLVNTLRQTCAANATIEYREHARVTRIDGQNLAIAPRGGTAYSVRADLIVGASGRASVAHQALGLDRAVTSYSRMAGLILEQLELPFEGYGHVFLGGPGPVLAYRVAHNKVRLCIDVPMGLPVNRERALVLWDAYGSVFPECMKASFRRALEDNAVAWAQNQIKPREKFGREGLVLVGDAAGHTHPLTAVGMTLGFQDAVALAEAKSFASYQRTRLKESRVPEMLAIGLYEVFADPSDETVRLRRAVFDMWRSRPEERLRTMGFLSGLDTNALSFARSFGTAVVNTGSDLVNHGLLTNEWGHVKDVSGDLADRLRWLLKGALHLTLAEPTLEVPSAEERYGKALKASRPRAEVVEHPSFGQLLARRAAASRDPKLALESGVAALLKHQDKDGTWEGEVVWCPMLAAQYALTHHLTGKPISAARKERLLLHFFRTQREDGTWGLHELSEPYLFVTVLVYVASRLLGVDANDPRLAGARRFIEAQGGALEIPSWGKFWLATLNLYDWDGVNPIAPEAWHLPKALPLHPSRFYCHTRQIYLGMACIYASRLQAHVTPTIAALREELFPNNKYEDIDFTRYRSVLRDEEIFSPHSMALRTMNRGLVLAEHLLKRRTTKRNALLDELRDHVRYELRATSHTSISPVSGLLNIIALWAADPTDEDAAIAMERVETWVWDDDIDGARVAGARSLVWDTAFAVQALAAARPHVEAEVLDPAMNKAEAALRREQIARGTGAESQFYRLDPTGGYGFCGVWHGWPVSDCTAEALSARLHLGDSNSEELERAAQFIMRTENPKGGFGSYESRRVQMSLEWFNPAEMFGDSMTERGYAECTASCLIALSEYIEAHPERRTPAIERALKRGVKLLRQTQRPDGSFEGNWGVTFIYGTMFGIRGLLAGGVPRHDPDVRRACQWLLDRQKADGGWGERHLAGNAHYVEHNEGQVTQTAWALMGLLEAQEPDFAALERGARWLAEKQMVNGEWPKQDPVGVFFHTALLDYVLYRQYFPVWALGMFQTRAEERALLATKERVVTA